MYRGNRTDWTSSRSQRQDAESFRRPRAKRDNMTKAEIVRALHNRVEGLSKKESMNLVELVFEMLKETLSKGEKIKLSGFGNFVLRDKRQRPGRNPRTGIPLKITERRVVTFKASQILKQAINPQERRSADSADGPRVARNAVNVLSGDAAGGKRNPISDRVSPDAVR
jgi:integration host factor subunit alpha